MVEGLTVVEGLWGLWRVGGALVTCPHSRSRSASYITLSLSLSLSPSLVEDLTVVNWKDEGLVELRVQATLNLY